MIPGELLAGEGEIELNAGRKTARLTVANTGDRPIQVGSHFHFFECNEALRFDRAVSRGFRLNIAAGTAVRFEPGQERDVELVALSGDRIVYGFNGKIMGALDRVKVKKGATAERSVQSAKLEKDIGKMKDTKSAQDTGGARGARSPQGAKSAGGTKSAGSAKSASGTIGTTVAMRADLAQSKPVRNAATVTRSAAKSSAKARGRK